MSKAVDSAAVESRGILGEIADFGQSTLHTAIESPINGLIQVIDHAADIHLPELNIIGAPTHDSYGARAGAIAGAAIDVVAVSVATAGVADIIGAVGVAGGVATAAATGAIYGGLLTPTDNKSEHFLEDRLTNGAVGAATFAAMGGAAKLLGATGLWAVPEARSLVGSITYGATAGAAGGLVSAEATAVLKDGKAFPSAEELATKVGTQALFGGAIGGLGYAYNQVLGPASRSTETTSGDAKITTINDSNGNPVAFEARVPSANSSDQVLLRSTKMTDGTWKTNGYAISKYDGGWSNDAYIPKVTGVTRAPDGTVTVNTEGGDVRTFAPGKYTKGNPQAEAEAAARDYAYKYFDRTNSSGEHEISTPKDGYRKLDAQGNTLQFADKANGSNGATIAYDNSGAMKNVYLQPTQDGPGVYLQRTGADTWRMTKGNDIYQWQGNIEQIKDGAGLVKGLKFTGADGKPLTFDLTSGSKQIAAAVDSAAKYQGIADGVAWVKANANGEVTLKPSRYAQITVNGKVASGEVVAKAGDEVIVKMDVGDRFAVWENRQLQIGRQADGSVVINNQPIGSKPFELSEVPMTISNEELARQIAQRSRHLSLY